MSASLLGNNIGRIYFVDLTYPAVGSLVNTDPNTLAGVRAMRDRGANVAPIASERQPFAIIQFTALVAPVSVTAISVLAINQMSAPEAYVAGPIDNFVAAVAANINGFAPANPFGDIQAQAVGNSLYLFGTTQSGPTINNVTPVVTSTVPANVTTVITPFRNGAVPSGAFDPFFGYRFILNPAAGATPNLAGATAPGTVDVTRYMVNRGLNAGLQNIYQAISGDRIVGGSWQRISGISQLLVAPEVGVGDVLAYIDPSDFVVGDLIYLRVQSPTPLSQIVVVESAPNTGSPVPTPNIYLDGNVAYTLTGTNTLVLQCNPNASGEPSWFEVSRSETRSTISITLLDFRNEAIASTLIPGQQYLITNLNDGTYVTATDVDTYDVSATTKRYVPSAPLPLWRAGMGAPVAGTRYRYYQLAYESLTGVVGGPPDTDLVNWALVPKPDIFAYSLIFNRVILNTTQLLTLWPIVEESDANSNLVRQSLSASQTLAANAYQLFKWSEPVAAATTLSGTVGNTVIDSVFDCCQIAGGIQRNYLYNSVFKLNTYPLLAQIRNNIFYNSSIQNNVFELLIGNSFTNSTITGNGSSLFPNIKILNSNGNHTITNNTYNSGTSATITLNGDLLTFSNNVFNNNATVEISGEKSDFSNSVVKNTVTCSITFSLFNLLDIDFITNLTATDCIVSGQFVTISGDWSRSVVDGAINFVPTTSIFAQLQSVNFLGISAAAIYPIQGVYAGLYVTGPQRIDSIAVTAVYGVNSSGIINLDLNDPAILTGTDLYIPADTMLNGTYVMYGTGTKTIDNIHWPTLSGTPNYATVKFTNISGGLLTAVFNTTPVGSYSAVSQIFGDAASYTVAQTNPVGPPDFIEIGDIASGFSTANYVYNYRQLI